LTGDDKPIIKKTISNEFMICETCGYKDGFHTYFIRIDKNKLKLNYKCPECGQRYDIGFIIDLWKKVKKMNGTCECNSTGKAIQYKCKCEENCDCCVIEFDEDPKTTPYCCGVPMKRIK